MQQMLPLNQIEANTLNDLSARLQNLSQQEYNHYVMLKNRYEYNANLAMQQQQPQPTMMYNQPQPQPQVQYAYDNFGNLIQIPTQQQFPQQNLHRMPNRAADKYVMHTASKPAYQGTPFTSFGGIEPPTAADTVNNSMMKYGDAVKTNIYNEDNRNNVLKEQQKIYNQTMGNNTPAEVVVVQEPIPHRGHEYMPLIPPHMGITKTVDSNNLYEYTINEHNTKGDFMDFNEHESVYLDKVESIEFKINPADEKDIKFIDEQTITSDIDTAFDKMLLEFDETETKCIVKPYSIISAFTVKKLTTDSTDATFATIIRNSKDLYDLSIKLRNLMHPNDTITSKAVERLSDKITEIINIGFKDMLNSSSRIDSFIYDMKDVVASINGYTDEIKKNRFNTMLINVFNAIKSDNDSIKSGIDIEENNSKIGLAYFVEKTILITANNEDIHYELLNMNKTEVKSLNKELTPVIDDLINNVNVLCLDFTLFIKSSITGVNSLFKDLTPVIDDLINNVNVLCLDFTLFIKSSITGVKSLNKELTPVIDDLINNVKSKHKTFTFFIIDYIDASVYRVIKSSLDRVSVLEKIR